MTTRLKAAFKKMLFVVFIFIFSGIVFHAGSAFAADVEDEEVATRIGSKTCLACHEDRSTIRSTRHVILFKTMDENAKQGCESCHGAGSLHIEDPAENILNFNKDAGPTDGSAACLACHRRGDVKFWDVSDHAEEDMNCVDCHQIHKPSEKQLKAPQTELCASCHTEKGMEILMPGRHPIKEGKVSCSQCHSPHGNLEMAYEGSSLTLSCGKCHQEKVGPFAFEHEPVVESCLNCHQVHGSPNKKLLEFKEPALCLQCHTGGHLFQLDVYSSKCTECHTSKHGSNQNRELLR